MSSYSCLYEMKMLLLDGMKQYALANDCVGESYYTALVFIEALWLKAFRDEMLGKQIANWFQSQSSLELKLLLGQVHFQDQKLSHYNAFALIDTLKIKI